MVLLGIENPIAETNRASSAVWNGRGDQDQLCADRSAVGCADYRRRVRLDEVGGVVSATPIVDVDLRVLVALQAQLDVRPGVVPVLVFLDGDVPIARLVRLCVPLFNHELFRVCVLQIRISSQYLASLGLVTDCGGHAHPESLVEWDSLHGAVPARTTQILIVFLAVS